MDPNAYLRKTQDIKGQVDQGKNTGQTPIKTGGADLKNKTGHLTNSVFKNSSCSNVLLAYSGRIGSGQFNFKNQVGGKTKQTESSGFNLFTHQAKRDLEGTSGLVFDYASLREAVLELYLSVKIRSDDEIDDYGKDLFQKEKGEMKNVDGFKLIDHIKSSVEMLMNMKMDD